MASRPWQTNASAHVDEFIRRKALSRIDADAIYSAVRRLEVDPFDVPAIKDHVGEWHYRIGPSATEPDSILAVTYRIDRDFRHVEIISFELYPGRGL
ncbi:hypothetical protein [Candidatus Poriferisocius sp.]|uniref:hypothetical protein n=1 Tax=Candidatus Poriferisocius sp. TaxID=3101276 RepID=UPI003B02D331